MEEKQVSVTALISAYIRSYHALHATPKIFDDYLAKELLTEGEHLHIGQNLAAGIHFFAPEHAASCTEQTTALAAVMRAISTSILVSRARYTEDNLEVVIKKGVQQYVILGAGLDTFAFRQPEMLKQLQVFEVDHPATQASKRHRLAGLGWKLEEELHFVPIDFMKEDLASTLKQSAYDSQKLSFYSWLGVTYYLTRDVVLETLQAITKIAPTGSTIIFDYLDNEAFDPEKTPIRVQRMQEAARRSGEPMKTGFNPSTLATDLEGIGLSLHENLNPSEIQQRYFQGRSDGYQSFENLHFAWAMVK